MPARLPLVLAGGKVQQQQSGDALTLQASLSTSASINIPAGVAPTAPNNGDIWTTASGIYVRINGATVGPLGPSASSYTPPPCQNVKARVLAWV
jgi:hypothetical protein